MTKRPATPNGWRTIKLFDELTWPEVAAAIRARAPIILPVGATEQHGEHMPLGTDNFQGIEMVRRAAWRLKAEGIPLVLGPVIPFGLRPFLIETPRDYPGTISLSTATMKGLVEEVCAELIQQGFRTLHLLNGHAENDAVVQLVAKELTERTPAHVMTLNWLVGIRKHYKGILRSKRNEGHGGEGETARMLATAPHLVHMDRARAYYPRPPKGPAIEADVLPYLGGAIGRYRPPAGMFAGLKGGITGDPRLATAETGEKVYALITDWICSVVRQEWLASGRARRGERGGRGGRKVESREWDTRLPAGSRADPGPGVV
jgi:creatinine amidohydrolase